MVKLTKANVVLFNLISSLKYTEGTDKKNHLLRITDVCRIADILGSWP